MKEANTVMCMNTMQFMLITLQTEQEFKSQMCDENYTQHNSGMGS